MINSTPFKFDSILNLNLLISTNILLIDILSVFSIKMFIITIIFVVTVVAAVVIISLFYLWLNKTRKKTREAITVNTKKYCICKAPHRSSPTVSPIFHCSRKKHSAYCHFCSCFKYW